MDFFSKTANYYSAGSCYVLAHLRAVTNTFEIEIVTGGGGGGSLLGTDVKARSSLSRHFVLLPLIRVGRNHWKLHSRLQNQFVRVCNLEQDNSYLVPTHRHLVNER